MSKIVLDEITSGYQLSKVNENFQKIEDELNNRVLYRNAPDGEANTVEKDIDLNGKKLYNVGDIQFQGFDSLEDLLERTTTAAEESEASRDAAEVAAENAAISAASASTYSGSAVVRTFSGNGSTVAFNLTAIPRTKENTQVYIGSVYQRKSTYSVTDNILTFNTAPPAGTNNIEVVIFESVFVPQSGYTIPVAYSSGILLSQYNQLVEYNSEFYKLKAGQAPYTTTGTWSTDSAKLVSVGDAALRQDLAAADGADRVGYGAGTVQDALDERLPEVANYAAVRAGLSGLPAVYVRGRSNIFDGGAGIFRLKAGDTTTADNGATVLVDGVSGARYFRDYTGDVRAEWAEVVSGDTGTAIRAAISQLGLLGGAVAFGRGTYVVGASEGNAIDVATSVSIRGQGGVYCAINPLLATSSDDTLKITPSPSVDCSGITISGVSLHNPENGLRTGRHGVFVDTQTAGANAAALQLRDMTVGQGSGYAFLHINIPANNVNGGLFGSVIDSCRLKGGVKLDNSGDSNSITRSIITGTNIGVHASLTPGASLLEVQANNITCAGGAFRLDAGSRPRLVGNNIEHYSTGAAAQNNSAVVNFTGDNGVIYGGVIRENLVSAFGGSDATTLIRLRNCRGILVQDNVLLSGGTATVGIDIGADCANVRIGANGYNSAVTTRVVDNGVGTMGVLKTATLENGWVPLSGAMSPLQFIKSLDGVVTLRGCIKDGTTTNGTLITTLPVGFRPALIERAMIFVVNAGTPQVAELTIESDGSVRINFVLANTQVEINVSFPATLVADFESGE